MKSVSNSDGATASSPAASPTTAQPQRSVWHSPVPYLFGGLSAMMCLIMFALLILACSYWRHSGPRGGNRDLENGDGGQKEGDSGVAESVQAYQEKILVIMAGDEKPTYLATPVSAYCSSPGDGVREDFEKEQEDHEKCEKTVEEMDHRVPATSTTPPENEGARETQQHNQ